MKPQCHWGSVTITIPDLPTKLNRCSCSICRRYGALWSYYETEKINVSGVTDTYDWGDRMIEFHRCQACGVLTHWTDIGEEFGKIGVNMQNVDFLALDGIADYDGHTRMG